MCGIIGYIGDNVEQNLIAGLEKLEYRGYDSAGMVIKRKNDFDVYKSIGAVENLKNKVIRETCDFKDETKNVVTNNDLDNDKMKNQNDKETQTQSDFSLGIAHTRWATHGKISLENCHPHFSSQKDVALVHNGIIENFETLKNELLKQGCNFYGETDSEVVAKLIAKLDINSLRRTIKKLEGSFAIVLISKNSDNLFFAKNKSPLYVAVGESCAMVASDPSCFVGKAAEYYSLEDGEYGKISLKEVVFYDKNDKIIEKKAQNLDFRYINEEKSGYEHFMIKEIYQSRIALENIIKRYQEDEIKDILKKVKQSMFDRVYFIGCGTAYHAGLIGESFMRNSFNIDIFSSIASEFQNKNYCIDENSLCIFLSQSGETADTLSALEYCRLKGAKILTITNTEYSTMALKSDYCLPICAGQEKSVASTKAYFAQCIVLYILKKYLQGKDYIEPLKNLKKQLDFGDDNILKPLARNLSSYDKVFFIGRGNDYITAKEASLKLKEITYIFSSALASGELKHGTLALIDENVLVVVVATDEKLFNKTLNNAYEIKARGGKLALFTSIPLDEIAREKFDYVVKINQTIQEFMPIQTILQLQKIAYFTAVIKGINPDKPRNLAKSVTVE